MEYITARDSGAVIAAGVEPPDYASQLVAIARELRVERHAWVPAAAIVGPSHFERRITAMSPEPRDAGLGDVRHLPNAWRTVVGTHRKVRQPVTLNALRLAPYEALLLDDATR